MPRPSVRSNVCGSTRRPNRSFRAYFIQRSLPRARWATAIYLALVAVVTAINMRGTMIPFAAVGTGTDLSVAPRRRLPGARGDSRCHRDPRAAASLSMDREHGRDRHGHERHDDQRTRRGGGPAAIPDGRRARRRLRDVVPRPAVSRRAGRRHRVADLVHRHRLVSRRIERAPDLRGDRSCSRRR